MGPRTNIDPEQEAAMLAAYQASGRREFSDAQGRIPDEESVQARWNLYMNADFGTRPELPDVSTVGMGLGQTAMGPDSKSLARVIHLGPRPGA